MLPFHRGLELPCDDSLDGVLGRFLEEPLSLKKIFEARTKMRILGFRLGESGELVPHKAEQEAIREMVALRTQGNALRTIAEAMQRKGHRISHEGVAGVLRVAGR